VASKAITPKHLNAALKNTLEKFDKIAKSKAEKGLRMTVIKVWGRIIVDTPIDDGRARGNWFINTKVTDETGGANKNKGSIYVQSSTPKNLLAKGTKLYLFNNLPYIHKLEYGGYGDGKETVNGFSKQAPKGMVRKNLLKWRGTLNESFKSLSKK